MINLLRAAQCLLAGKGFFRKCAGELLWLPVRFRAFLIERRIRSAGKSDKRK